MIRFLPWDSKLFKKKIGKIDSEIGNFKSFKRILDKGRKSFFDCLYYEGHLPAARRRILEKNGAFLSCIKVRLRKKLKKSSFKLNQQIFLAGASHKKNLLSISMDEVAMKSRFASDPKFGKKAARLLYRTWLLKALKGKYAKAVICYVQNTKPVGFISLRVSKKRWMIDLFGVSRKHQGKGIGQKLLEAAELYARVFKQNVLDVITQKNNIAGLKSYQKAGYKVVSETPVYHLWIK